MIAAARDGSRRGRGGRARGRGGTSGEALVVAEARVDRLRRARQARGDGGVDDPARAAQSRPSSSAPVSERRSASPSEMPATAGCARDRRTRPRRRPPTRSGSGARLGVGQQRDAPRRRRRAPSTFGTWMPGDARAPATTSRSASPRPRARRVDPDVDRLLARRGRAARRGSPRASAFAPGATPSSRSTITACAAEAIAFSTRSGRSAGT